MTRGDPQQDLVLEEGMGRISGRLRKITGIWGWKVRPVVGKTEIKSKINLENMAMSALNVILLEKQITAETIAKIFTIIVTSIMT